MSLAELEPYVRAAADYVRRAVGLELDGSETSLAFLDHYAEQVRASEPMAPDVLALAAASLGAYFGEVVRGRLGGRWQLSAVPAEWTLTLDAGPLTLHPVGMAAAALVGDEVAGYDASFHTSPERAAPLEEALAAAPPVDEAYYYSFTGRLETLVHAAELLAELEHLAKQRS
jgi:hypothetical protein